MFFSTPKLPVEIILDIVNRLSLKDATSFLLLTTEMNGFIKTDSIWRKFGAENFENFVMRMRKLPQKYQKLILNESATLSGEKYNLNYVETLIQNLKNILDIDKAIENYIDIIRGEIRSFQGKCGSFNLLATTHDGLPWGFRLGNNLLESLRDGVITIEEVSALGSKGRDFVNNLFIGVNFIALQNGMVTIEEISALPNSKDISPYIKAKTDNSALSPNPSKKF